MTAARNNRRKAARLAMADQVQAATTEAAAWVPGPSPTHGGGTMAPTHGGGL